MIDVGVLFGGQRHRRRRHAASSLQPHPLHHPVEERGGRAAASRCWTAPLRRPRPLVRWSDQLELHPCPSGLRLRIVDRRDCAHVREDTRDRAEQLYHGRVKAKAPRLVALRVLLGRQAALAIDELEQLHVAAALRVARQQPAHPLLRHNAPLRRPLVLRKDLAKEGEEAVVLVLRHGLQECHERRLVRGGGKGREEALVGRDVVADAEQRVDAVRRRLVLGELRSAHQLAPPPLRLCAARPHRRLELPQPIFALTRAERADNSRGGAGGRGSVVHGIRRVVRDAAQRGPRVLVAPLAMVVEDGEEKLRARRRSRSRATRREAMGADPGGRVERLAVAGCRGAPPHKAAGEEPERCESGAATGGVRRELGGLIGVHRPQVARETRRIEQQRTARIRGESLNLVGRQHRLHERSGARSVSGGWGWRGAASVLVGLAS
mmetsp:Transcript_5235/g.17026  ORF Transcript_5235/g.17026 Transcript_5235/m.17026 type:complete len:436 (+) Transcript_5235:673-1980(+)